MSFHSLISYHNPISVIIIIIIHLASYKSVICKSHLFCSLLTMCSKSGLCKSPSDGIHHDTNLTMTNMLLSARTKWLTHLKVKDTNQYFNQWPHTVEKSLHSAYENAEFHLSNNNSKVCEVSHHMTLPTGCGMLSESQTKPVQSVSNSFTTGKTSSVTPRNHRELQVWSVHNMMWLNCHSCSHAKMMYPHKVFKSLFSL